MNLKKARIAGLDCQIVDALPQGKSPELIVMLCHGLGAPGTDLVPLGPEILRLKPRLTNAVRFYFPAGPLHMDQYGLMGCRAWWPIDMEQLNRAMMQGQRISLRNENPPQLADARGLLTQFLEDVSRDTGLPLSSFVLGGFSQGAMLTADVSLRLPSAPAALCLFSGTLLCEQEWRPLAKQRGPMRVFQSHGRQDVLLSFDAAEVLRDMLIEGGMQVEFIPFNGPHTIPMEAVEGFANMLEGIADKK